jgi:hypothetical protein
MPYGPAPMIKQGTNGMAVAALVLGIVGLFCGFFVPSILGIVFGFLARKQIDESGGLQQGEGMALAGIITGFIGIIGWIIIVIIAVATDDGPYYYDSLFTVIKMSMPLLPLLPFL